MKAYYTAEQIINEALVGIGDAERRNYQVAAMYFMRGYRDFALFNSVQFKESWLTINTQNRTVKLPEDCLHVDKLGLIINGEIFTFTESTDMPTPSDPLNSDLLSDRREDGNIVRIPTTGYGAKGSNLEYYFHVDMRKRRIILNRLFVDKTRLADSSEVLLRYVSNNVENLVEAIIDGDSANMLISYVEWKLISSRPDLYDRGYRAEKKMQFEEDERKYRLLSLPSVQELLDAMYETSGQGVRL